MNTRDESTNQSATLTPALGVAPPQYVHNPMLRHPMFRALTEHSKTPFDPYLGVLSVIIGIAGMALMLGLMYLAETQSWIATVAVVVGLLSLSLVVVIPAFALILTTLFVKTGSAQEQLAMIRLTNLSGKEIAGVYTAASRYNLRVLKAAGRGLIPMPFLVLAFMIGTNIIIFDCFTPPCGSLILGYTFAGFVPALVLGAFLFWSTTLLYGAAINTGVWIGFKYHDAAPGVAGGILVTVFVLLMPLAFLGLRQFMFMGLWGLSLLICPLSILVLPGGLTLLERFTRHGAARAVQD
jgi:hypothetical protein